jgi:MFS family permease
VIAGKRWLSRAASGPLRFREFRLLVAGQATSTVGDYFYVVALPWYVLSARGGAILLGTVLACYGVPRTALILVGGSLSDRIGPRKVMLIADVGRCLLTAVMAFLAARHVLDISVLGPVVALVGVGDGLFMPAASAMTPTLLPSDDLQAGNGISSALQQFGSLVGPGLAGVLVAAAGPAPAFITDAVTFAISAVSLALMRRRADPHPAEAASNALGDDSPASWRDVLALFRAYRVLQIGLVINFVANLAAGGTFEVALPTLAHRDFGAQGYGVLMAVLSAGLLLGSLAAGRRGNWQRPAVVAYCFFLASTVGEALIPFAGGLIGAAGAAFAFGACTMFANVLNGTLAQKWYPPKLLGRSMSLFLFMSAGLFPVSVAVAGLLVKAFGPGLLFPIAAGMVSLAVVGALTQRQCREFGAPGSAPAETPVRADRQGQSAELAR